MEIPVGGISCRTYFKSPRCKVLNQPDVNYTLINYISIVLVPADKAANNMTVVCNKYYVKTLIQDLGMNNPNTINATYVPASDSFGTILKNYNQFMASVKLELSEGDQNPPYLYWTPKFHKPSYKHPFTCSWLHQVYNKRLSCLLTELLSVIKDELVWYYNTKTNGVNNMWSLKTFTTVLSSLDQLDVRTATSVQTLDF